MRQLEALKEQNISICVHKYTLLFFVLWFPLIKPNILDYPYVNNNIDLAYNALRVASFIVAIVMYAVYCQEWRSILIGLLLIAMVYMAVITEINEGNLLHLFVELLEFIEICVIVHIAYDFDAIKNCLHSVVLVLAINLTINAYTVFRFYQYGGMYSNYIKNVYYLGHDNTHIIYLLSFLALSLLYDLWVVGHVRLITVFFHILFNSCIIRTWSGTSLVSITLFYVCSYLLSYKKVAELLNSYTIVAGTLLSWAYFILQRKYYIMIDFFNLILGKNLRTVRQFIWTLYEKAIRKGNIVFGQGYMLNSERVIKVGILHAHDMYLDIVYESGIVGLALATIIVFICLKKSDGIRNGAMRFVVAAICAFLVEYQVETLNKSYFVILLVMSYYCSKYIKIKES